MKFYDSLARLKRSARNQNKIYNNNYNNDGTYLNYTSADDQRAVQTLVVGTETRIANVKSQYDPNNYFRRNHNVLPYKLTAKEEHCI